MATTKVKDGKGIVHLEEDKTGTVELVHRIQNGNLKIRGQDGVPSTDIRKGLSIRRRGN